jgi:DNA-3-methyladenine glycosylase II
MITPKAKKYLIKSDPRMAKLVKTLKMDRWQIRENHFHSLVGSIISQQLSTKAASTIRKRFIEVLGSKKFTYKHILQTPFRKMRSAGLSANKVRFIKGLARASKSKKLDFGKIRLMSDEQVIEELIAHKGIGRWTAEMFLIFSLGRPDVFSLGDWGLRSAVMKIYKPKNSDPKTILKITEKWKPYRSTASLYLWASLDNK